MVKISLSTCNVRTRQRPKDSLKSYSEEFRRNLTTLLSVGSRSSFAVRRAAHSAKPILARGAQKEIKFSNEGRASILAGVDILAKAVSVTLGPKGRNVIIEQAFGGPKITKDGVTVAKAITLKDKFQNLGARLVQDVAQKTNERAGDGATTATVLARAVYDEGVKNVAAAITTSEEIAQVATISANGDTHIGNLIATSMKKVGKEGVTTVKEGRTTEDELEITEGMRFDRVYISPYFITDVKSQKVEFEKPLILCRRRRSPCFKISFHLLRPQHKLAGCCLSSRRMSMAMALAACILNKLRGQLQVAAVKAPGFGDNRKSVLGDLAILTGGTVFTDELDIKLERATSDLLGSTGSVTITKEDTIFLNGEGSKDAIQARCEQIRAMLNDVGTSEYDKTKLQERLAKLSGGVAVIKVGGSSEVEVGEKKDRYDDALNATRAAVEEGILPGGGVALLKASLALPSSTPGTSGSSSTSSSNAAPIPTANFDQELGISIIRRALSQPARTILTNAGEESSVIVGTLLSHPPYALPENFAMGYDAQKGCYVDMIKSGIVDPLKVVRTALVDAAGVTSLLTTSEACIVEAEEKEKPNMGGMGGGMGGTGGMGGF